MHGSIIAYLDSDCVSAEGAKTLLFRPTLQHTITDQGDLQNTQEDTTSVALTPKRLL